MVIWKVRSMVVFLSSRLTNPFMFDIIFNSYLSPMLGYKLYEDTKYSYMSTGTVCKLEKAKCP